MACIPGIMCGFYANVYRGARTYKYKGGGGGGGVKMGEGRVQGGGVPSLAESRVWGEAPAAFLMWCF